MEINKTLQSLFENCVSIDVETTGLDPVRNGIISIGAVTFDGKEFYSENYLKGGAEINARALEVNGETSEGILKRNISGNYISEEWSLLKLNRFVADHPAKPNVIIGKNPSFDYGFLWEIWKQMGNSEENFPFSYRKIDYSSLAIPLMLKEGFPVPSKGFSSSDIQNFLELPEEPKPHNALTGAKYNIMCLEKIMKEYNFLIKL